MFADLTDAPPLAPPLPDETTEFRLALSGFVRAFANRHLRGKTLGESALMLRIAADLLERREDVR